MNPTIEPAPRYVALIPAAGVGARMGGTTPKQYLSIYDQAILRHTVQAFLAAPEIAHTYVVVSADDAYVDAALNGLDGVSILRCGGATRRDTVSNGLQALASVLGQHDWVLVHDAARPGLTPALLTKLIQQVGQHAVGGLLALPVVDTVKRVVDGRVETIARDGLWLAQTPQMFRYGLLSDALARATEVTDEASAIEAMGKVPLLIEGHACNVKVTLPSDLALVQRYLAAQLQ
ncbi:MAG: 2-C-methyl-D-erythritol 4-phosphate cytidylyltransferase [Undibacterium sp.]|uniref:2-C-methyl-D-erythritol 4-phosphate cytidylyltransferase n=1 Tax=Undibacterium sp. TaxID=1914977 RepID=UPI002720B714|nr:2-C-methyl-D-erythritol 4-phosphate cytidylyltransferase [Undibacterium sp.]MDO8654808.1 2-C-methyl-D-erythritol 4-phosphate cytidylyltransferase [Undibacterium sp.]